MNKLTKEKFQELYKDDKNLTDKPIFIDFYADWWGPCKQFEQVLNEVMSEYDDKINMYKVDISDQQELSVMFGARGIPYMAFISKDGDITSQTGGLDENTLKYFLDGLIAKN